MQNTPTLYRISLTKAGNPAIVRNPEMIIEPSERNIMLNAYPTSKTVRFVADKLGVFTYKCGVPFDSTATPVDCSPEHEYQLG